MIVKRCGTTYKALQPNFSTNKSLANVNAERQNERAPTSMREVTKDLKTNEVSKLRTFIRVTRALLLIISPFSCFIAQ